MIQIRDLITLINKKNLDDYDKKYIKIRLDSDDNLPLNKTIEIPIATIVIVAIGAVRPVILKNNKYYPQAFLDEYLHKI